MNFIQNNWKIITFVIVIIVAITGVKFFRNTPNVTTSGIASITLNDLSANTIEVGDLQKINWTAVNYAAPTVSINIIRKVGDNPARYELVRTVAPATTNDGSAVWVPAKTDVGTNTFVEVGCTLTAQECHASKPTFALAVINTGLYSNTANTYKAIEQLNNK